MPQRVEIRHDVDESTPPAARAGKREPNDAAKLERVDLMLDRESITWLDHQRLDIRESTGIKTSRSQFVRLILWAAQVRGLSLGSCTNEQQILGAMLGDPETE